MPRALAEVTGSMSGRSAGFTLHTSAGPSLGFALGPSDPARPIRVSAGRPGRRSSVWRIWANKKKSDVYIASRRSAGLFKVSLHESGDWRIQWVGEDHGDAIYRDISGNQVTGRILQRWSRPPANAAGWTDALWIRIPSLDITSIPGDDEDGGATQWLDDPGPGRLVDIRLMIVQPNVGLFNVGSALEDDRSTIGLVNGFRLPSGEVVVVMHTSNPLSQKQDHDLRALRREEVRKARRDKFDIRPESGPKAALIEIDERDQHRSIWDLSLALD